jgi:hypothetical protein
MGNIIKPFNKVLSIKPEIPSGTVSLPKTCFYGNFPKTRNADHKPTLTFHE